MIAEGGDIDCRPTAPRVVFLYLWLAGTPVVKLSKCGVAAFETTMHRGMATEPT